MDGIILVALVLLGVPIVAFIWLGSKATRASRDVRDLQSRLEGLQAEVRDLRRGLGGQPQAGAPAPAATAPVPIPQPSATTPSVAHGATQRVAQKPVLPPEPVPPALVTKTEAERVVPESKDTIAAPPSGVPAQAPRPILPPAISLPPERPAFPGVNLEMFMGVKLFAWIGGLALFLGLAFFVKYSFENNLVTPEMRIAIGFVTGAGLLVGGLVMTHRDYEVLGLTLCGTGILGLYATSFAAHSFYHLIGVAPAFAIMILVTTTAFLLAVKLDAQVVAVLGLLGGFLTPVLLSTGQDHPLGLFGYIGLLDAGLIAIASRKYWSYQVLLAAVGTVLMQISWVVTFFNVEKQYTAMGIFLGMEALFLLGFVLGQKRDETDKYISVAAFLTAFAPLVFTLYLLGFPTLGGSPAILFTFVLVADLGLLTLATLRQPLYPMHLVAGGAVFLLLTIWTLRYLTNPLLNWALGFYLLFAILHSAYPVVLERLRPGVVPVWWGHLFAPLALFLVMIPVVRFPELSWLIWLCVLLLDVVVFALALVTGWILAIIGALILTVAAMALWILNVPATLTGLPDLLVVIGGFALVFFAAGIFAVRRFAEPADRTPTLPSLPWLAALPGDMRAQIPACSAVLPFLLLIMVVLRLPLANPSPVFGLAMLLVVLLLGVARWTEVDWLAAVALGCAAALECVWHMERFKPESAVVSLIWYLAFVAVFTVFPFVFRRTMENRIIPWAVAALAGPVHFTLVHRLIKAAWPNPFMGALPAMFAIPPLIGLVYLIRVIPIASAKRFSLLAWFGGATLFFITLIFPIQFERQWITIGWALEGAALLWLFHRVPQAGLRLVGVALLVTAFVRLGLNPAVLTYHPRSATPIWNWYLYAYGIVTVCLMVGGRLLAPPRHQMLDVNVPPLLHGLGTVLAFLLLNIEISDYFSPGSTLTFQFSGSFARDMTYSIAWALFAFLLLVVGIARKVRPARYASLALLSVTLLKLFLHDLASLSQLYRIGAFIGVAVVSLTASFVYQRFVSAEGKQG